MRGKMTDPLTEFEDTLIAAMPQTPEEREAQYHASMKARLARLSQPDGLRYMRQAVRMATAMIPFDPDDLYRYLDCDADIVANALSEAISVIEYLLWMSEWQPIDTAPRDGSAICAGRWTIERRWDWGLVRWAVDGFVTSHGWPCKPTHWMPLPEPPEVKP